MDQLFEQFAANIPDQAVEVSDKSNIYQCMDLAYLWVFVLGYPKATIQKLYAYQAFTQASDLTRQYFDVIQNTDDFIPQQGDIGFFGKGIGVAGHVCICTGQGDLNRFESIDQNWKGVQRAVKVWHSYADFLGVLRPKKFSSECLIGKDEEGTKLFEKLVHNSTLADGFVKLLELADNADNVSLDTVKKSLSAREGKLTACSSALFTREKELAAAQQEVENRVEQIGRLKADSLHKEELFKDDIIKLKKQLENSPIEDSKWQTAYEQEHTKYLEEAKLKGNALGELAVAQTQIKALEDKIKTLEEGFDSDDRKAVYKLLRKMLEKIVGQETK